MLKITNIAMRNLSITESVTNTETPAHEGKPP